MLYFAELNPRTNEVLRLVIAKSKLWCEYELDGTWVKTYKNTEGKNFAGKGYIYHSDRDNFSSPQPYPSWTLDEQCHWQPPVPRPDDGGYYTWDEESRTWISSEGT